MAKKKISKKRLSSYKASNQVKLRHYRPTDPKKLDQEFLKSTLVRALIEGDVEMLKDVIIAQIRIHNKMDLVRKTKLGRQTLYDLLDSEKEFNPTIKTLSSLLRAIAA